MTGPFDAAILDSVIVESSAESIRGGRGPFARVAARLHGWVPRPPKPAILIYHRIADDCFDPWGLAVSSENFERQLSWLARNRTLLPLTELAARNADGALPPDAIAVTFDDGYRCNAEIAAPMLERHRVPATIFLPAALIEKGGQFWWDELETIVLDHEGPTISLDGETIALGDKRSDDRQWMPGAPPRTQRHRAYEQLQRRLMNMTPAGVERSMDALRSQINGSARRDSGKGPMSPEQAKRIASPLIEFGSHSLTHARLTILEPAEQEAEIVESADRCQTLTGSRPAAFAYPFGSFDEQSERLAEKAGYACACSIEHAPVTRESRRLALPRIQAGNWPAGTLARVLRAL